MLAKVAIEPRKLFYKERSVSVRSASLVCVLLPLADYFLYYLLGSADPACAEWYTRVRIVAERELGVAVRVHEYQKAFGRIRTGDDTGGYGTVYTPCTVLVAVGLVVYPAQRVYQHIDGRHRAALLSTGSLI
jgi:hypothetical protein